MYTEAVLRILQRQSNSNQSRSVMAIKRNTVRNLILVKRHQGRQ